MGEHSVDVPLWDDEGLLFASPEEFVQALGGSAGLVADIVTWARAWQTRSGRPTYDAEAAQFVRRIRGELGDGVRIVYWPWRSRRGNGALRASSPPAPASGRTQLVGLRSS